MNDRLENLAQILIEAADILERFDAPTEAAEPTREKSIAGNLRAVADRLARSGEAASEGSLKLAMSAMRLAAPQLDSTLRKHPEMADSIRPLLQKMTRAITTLLPRAANKPAVTTTAGPRQRKGSPFATSHIQFSSSAVDPPLRLQVSFGKDPRPDHWDTIAQDVPRALRDAVLQRDSHCCGFCGFRSHKFQEILVRGRQTWNMGALITACIFCAQVLTVDRTSAMRSGVLVETPEISQADLNALATLIYVCRISQGPPAQLARDLLDRIMARRDNARARLGYDDPYRLQADLNASRSAESRVRLLDACRDIRLFPLDRRIIKQADLEFNQFPQILAYWRSKGGPYGKHRPQEMDVSILESQIRDGLRSPVRFADPRAGQPARSAARQ